MHNTAIVAMGTNMSFRGVAGAALLRQAVTAMGDAGLSIRAASGVWQTAAWPPGVNQPDYYNAVVLLDADGVSPQQLYAKLRAIEQAFGRARRERWEQRTLDLDIIAMNGCVGTFGPVTLPHVRMQERVFVLAPLAEAAPDWRHPALGRTAAELLRGLDAGEGYRRIEDLAPADG